jgi:hypothetical protein
MRVTLESCAIHSGEVYLLHFVTTYSSQVVGQELKFRYGQEVVSRDDNFADPKQGAEA